MRLSKWTMGLIMALGAILALGQPAYAQLSFPTAASGVRVPGSVPLQCDASAANCAPPSATNPLPMGGTVASGAADSGNPVKIGAVYNATQPTLTTGQRGDAQLDTRANLKATLYGADTVTPVSVGSGALADGTTNTQTGAVTVRNSGLLFNNTSWDRARGNVDTGALVTHTAASAGTTSADQVNYNGRGLKLVIDVTAITGTSPTLTVTIQGKDTASGKYYTLLASAALTATGTTVLEVYPGVGVTANVSASTTLPRTWRVSTAIDGTTPAVTATIAASVIL